VHTVNECKASHVEKHPAAATMTMREAVAPVFNYIMAHMPADTDNDETSDTNDNNADNNDGSEGVAAVDAMETDNGTATATDTTATGGVGVSSNEQLLNATLPVPPLVAEEDVNTIQTVLHASDYYEHDHLQHCVMSAIADDRSRLVNDRSVLCVWYILRSVVAHAA
jgi:hypothetical protein